MLGQNALQNNKLGNADEQTCDISCILDSIFHKINQPCSPANRLMQLPKPSCH
jgi:hypothetical protein